MPVARSFAATIIAWQARAGRRNLPWQNTRDPYRIWLAEIMLQQTQVGTVIPYYQRFLTDFPTVASLAAAPLDAVMQLWAGLGYYSRARHLHRAAQAVMTQFDGAFPAERAAMETLPGVGRSTAAAIVAFAFGRREAILDGNVKRVLARHDAVAGYPGERLVERGLWARAEALLPEREIERYTQGMMDLGATVCTLRRPQCVSCPVQATCVAYATDRVSAYPTPRPRRALPHRTTYVVVLREADRILVERRPPSGIWGGLWSFPEAASAADAERVALVASGGATPRLRQHPPVRHGFTHFTLDIVPLVGSIDARPGTVESPGRLWLTLDEASNAALPAPIKKIVAALALG